MIDVVTNSLKTSHCLTFEYFSLQNIENRSLQEYCYICCGSILSLVQILFSIVFGMVMYDNEFKTKGNKI